MKHGDYAFAAISAAGIVPAAGDAAKGAAKAGRFILRNIDDPAKAARLLAILEESCPSVVAKLGGSDGFVKAAASFSQTGHARLTKKEKQRLVKAVKKAGLAKHLVTSGRDLPIAATIDTGKNVWNERWLKRGDIIDECLNGHSTGRGLGRTFPVADRLENRVLVSTSISIRWIVKATNICLGRKANSLRINMTPRCWRSCSRTPPSATTSSRR